MTYRFNQVVGVAAAVANFTTFYQNESNVIEFRLHQDLNINWPDLSFISLFYRLRLEQRWFYYENIQNDFNQRIRYLFGANSPDFYWFGRKRPIYFQLIWEGFRTIGGESALEVFIDRSRLHFAYGHRISGNFRYEFHFISQRSRQFADSGLEVTQNIFRVRTFHRINRKEDRNKPTEGQ